MLWGCNVKFNVSGFAGLSWEEHYLSNLKPQQSNYKIYIQVSKMQVMKNDFI